MSVGLCCIPGAAHAQNPSDGSTPVACIDGTTAASATLCNAYHGGLKLTPPSSGDTGKGMTTHEPVVITKEIGAASPKVLTGPTSGGSESLTSLNGKAVGPVSTRRPHPA